MSKHTYRRARTDYPEGVIAIYDEGIRAICDRYTVVYTPNECEGELWYTYACIDEFGRGSHGEAKHYDRPRSSWGRTDGGGAGKVIAFEALTYHAQRFVLHDLIPLCPECFCDGGDHFGDCSHRGEPTPYAVVDTRGVRPGERAFVLRRFPTEAEASAYIGTLPQHETGCYGLDGPADDTQAEIPGMGYEDVGRWGTRNPQSPAFEGYN